MGAIDLHEGADFIFSIFELRVARYLGSDAIEYLRNRVTGFRALRGFEFRFFQFQLKNPIIKYVKVNPRTAN